MSFQISVSANKRASALFIGRVRRAIARAFDAEPAITQTAIANELGVHRSVINRQLRGQADLTLGRVAELAWALGREIEFDLRKPSQVEMGNHPPIEPAKSLPKGVTIKNQPTRSASQNSANLVVCS